MQVRRLAAMIGIAAICSADTLAAAEPTPVLQPTTKWQMDYAADECRLLRSFGEGEKSVTLQFSRLDIEDGIEMTLVGQDLPITRGNQSVNVSTSSVKHIAKLFAEGIAGQTSAGGSRFAFSYNQNLMRALQSDAALGLQTRLGIGFRSSYAVALDLGTMRNPMGALERCVDDLLTEAGLDPTEQRKRRSGPKPIDILSWVKFSEVPKELIKARKGSRLIVRLLVGSDGNVTDCRIAKSGDNHDFQDLTCRMIKALKFHPAISASGEPIKSMFVHRIIWLPS